MPKNTASVSSAVVEAVAETSNTPPCDLPEQLHDVVDPDALDQLFAGKETEGHIQFEFCGYLVTVESEGAVTVKSAIGDNRDEN